MLRGNYLATVDEKGRVKIPADFLVQLRKLGTKFYVTSTAGDRAQIFQRRFAFGVIGLIGRDEQQEAGLLQPPRCLRRIPTESPTSTTDRRRPLQPDYRRLRCR